MTATSTLPVHRAPNGQACDNRTATVVVLGKDKVKAKCTMCGASWTSTP